MDACVDTTLKTWDSTLSICNHLCPWSLSHLRNTTAVLAFILIILLLKKVYMYLFLVLLCFG